MRVMVEWRIIKGKGNTCVRVMLIQCACTFILPGESFCE